MKLHKLQSILCILLFIISIGTLGTFYKDTTVASGDIIIEKRGIPSYDYIIGKDLLPHFRAFFWVDKNATKYIPYADAGVNTDVSSHGPAEKWSVVETNKSNYSDKLVFVFVPKTFVILHGKDFDKLIHLKYAVDK